ncbi:MAG: homocysteine S-methyltransferase family protein [Flavobacteriaceae bacterium]
MNQLNNNTILTDGGLETDLIFNRGIVLADFAAFPLVEQAKGREVLNTYYKEYLEIARKYQTGFILESPTWRANLDWGFKLGYSRDDLTRLNKKAIQHLVELREAYTESVTEILISGQIGPRGDGYVADSSMNFIEAMEYHNLQVSAFRDAGVDLVTAITMTYSEEALGIIKAAQLHDVPIVVSFTVETDGHLPSGESLREAINRLDEATEHYPLYYMINCAHPSHFVDRLENDEAWKLRIGGLRVNASCKSHEELDEATELDCGDREELAGWHKVLKSHLPNLSVFGGCCGTDASHVKAICKSILA